MPSILRRLSSLPSLAAFGCALSFSLASASAPASALNPFGDRGSEPIPEHDVHNQAPDAPAAALTWDELMNLEVTVESPGPLQTVFHVSYPDSLKAKDGTVVRIRGFMYPLEAGETHTYFLLSALPPSCPFCLPASARGLVEVTCDDGVRYTLQPVLLEGRFELMEEDDAMGTGLHYRLNNARSAS